jgi:acetyltransferase-like isoleucine patch superfamily enzyme
MIDFIKKIRRKIIASSKKRKAQKRCYRLGIEYADGVFVGENVRKWGTVKVILGKNVRIGSNTIFWGNGIITIGDNSHIGEDSWIYANSNGGVTIGSDVNIAARLYLIDSNHKFERGTLIRKQGLESACVSIGNDVWIAANVTIIKGANIGDGCVVGAASLVNKSFPDYSVIGGVPAKILKMR